MQTQGSTVKAPAGNAIMTQQTQKQKQERINKIQLRKASGMISLAAFILLLSHQKPTHAKSWVKRLGGQDSGSAARSGEAKHRAGSSSDRPLANFTRTELFYFPD